MTVGTGHRACLPPRILVSACLLGEKVRYDGGHKRDAFLVDTLGKRVEYVPVCPEVECGLPVPREAMRLSVDADVPRLLGIETGCEYTERMTRWTMGKVAELAPLGLRGYVCKKSSPSCGMGAGLFTKSFMERFRTLPVIDEERLQIPALRTTFLERIFGMPRSRPD